MTPQFTTPCFVLIEDAEKRKEIYSKIEAIGRDLYRTKESEYIFCFNNILGVGLASSLYGKGYRGIAGKIELVRDGVVNCGTNTELFLTLASMRSDTDKGQWFVTEEPISIGTNVLLTGSMFCLGEDKFDASIKAHRATAQEIIEHFNTKTK